MCGIVGIYAFTLKGKTYSEKIKEAVNAIAHRGPDNQAVFVKDAISLGHVRLSILDLSPASNQPLLNTERNNGIVFNGEIFNYKDLATQLQLETSRGDVEVLLKWIKTYGVEKLNDLNGFFSFSYADFDKQEVYVVRDRLGIKPLYYYANEDVLVWASEIKAILEIVGKLPLDTEAISCYFSLNYISGVNTIFKGIKRVPAGAYLHVNHKGYTLNRWHNLEKEQKTPVLPSQLGELLHDSVKLRLHADVPVGCFLSGGIDSSIVSAIAAKHHKDLHTFSLGFSDEPFFDETPYAELVAKHIGSNHHTLKVSNTELFENLTHFLDAIDEPFADSSALNMYVLSKYTKQYVKVALSGDGADELFMGYNKHKAEYFSNKRLYKHMAFLLGKTTALLPQSRHGKLSNKLRQVGKFSKTAGLSAKDRYWHLASISSSQEIHQLLKTPLIDTYKANLLEDFEKQDSIKAINLCDLKIVLADDMLVKVDRMSMQHGLEVRNPFLDYRIVEYALNLPTNYKMNGNSQKIILRDTFKNLLPTEIFTRKKKGFEVPLLKWINNYLMPTIENDWLSEDFVTSQNLFNYSYVKELLNKVKSSNPGDTAAKVWALIVFQHWYKKHIDYIHKDA